MLNAYDLVQSIKQASNEADEANQPCDFCYGVVMSEEPLQINVEQKMTLSTAQLVLSRNVTDFETEVTTAGYGWTTENETCEVAHKHKIEIQKKKIKVHNKLKTGEKVILLRKRGGQSYLVLDRVVDA